jgi:hypothetical protein
VGHAVELHPLYVIELLTFAASVAALGSSSPNLEPICYDTAVIARVIDYANDEALPLPNIGFRADLLIEVNSVLSGRPPRSTFWAAGILTDRFSSRTRLAIYLQKGGDAEAAPIIRSTPIGFVPSAPSVAGYRIVQIALAPNAPEPAFPECSP